MLSAFLEFLSYITYNLIEHLTHSSDDATFSKILYGYTLFARIARDLNDFADALLVWQERSFHGRPWSAAQMSVTEIDHILYVLGTDLYGLIGRSESAESLVTYCKLRGGPSSSPKFDVFDIWQRIVHRNAAECFSGWVTDRSSAQIETTIYIPSYSLLLPLVCRTSQLGDLSESQWQMINFEPAFHLLHPDLENLDHLAQTFLPEPPAEFPITSKEYIRLETPRYAKAIVVPSQKQEMAEVIEVARSCVLRFQAVVDDLRSAIVDEAENSHRKFSEVL